MATGSVLRRLKQLENLSFDLPLETVEAVDGQSHRHRHLPGGESVLLVTGLGGEEEKLGKFNALRTEGKGPSLTYLDNKVWSSSQPGSVEHLEEEMKMKHQEPVKKKIEELKRKTEEEEDKEGSKRKEEENFVDSKPTKSNTCISRLSRDQPYLDVGGDVTVPDQEAAGSSSSKTQGLPGDVRKASEELGSPFGGGRSPPILSTNGTLCASMHKLPGNIQFRGREDDGSRRNYVRRTTAGSGFRNILESQEIRGEIADTFLEPDQA